MQNERFERRPLRLITGPRRVVVAAIALLGFSAGVLATACKGFDRDPTSDQQAASDILKESDRKDQTIRIRIINPKDSKDPVNARSNPAVLSGNWIREFDPGKKEFDAIIVEPAEGRQQAEGDFSLWVAFDPPDSDLVFVNSHYVERTDGQSLTQGVEIQETRPDRPDVLKPIEHAQ